MWIGKYDTPIVQTEDRFVITLLTILDTFTGKRKEYR